MTRKLVIASIACLCIQSTIALAGSSLRSVQVRSAIIRDRPSFLSRVVDEAHYGDRLQIAREQGPWVEVKNADRLLGWMHVSALTRKRIVMKAGDDDIHSNVSVEEVALAGKGFNSSVEARYRERHGNDGFSWIDHLETIRFSSKELAEFLDTGGVRSGLGGKR